MHVKNTHKENRKREGNKKQFKLKWLQGYKVKKPRIHEIMMVIPTKYNYNVI